MSALPRSEQMTQGKAHKAGSSTCLPDTEAMYSVRECNLNHLKFT